MRTFIIRALLAILFFLLFKYVIPGTEIFAKTILFVIVFEALVMVFFQGGPAQPKSGL